MQHKLLQVVENHQGGVSTKEHNTRPWIVMKMVSMTVFAQTPVGECGQCWVQKVSKVKEVMEQHNAKPYKPYKVKADKPYMDLNKIVNLVVKCQMTCEVRGVVWEKEIGLFL